MYSWEVVCVELGSNRDYDDCRAIETIGFLGPSLKKTSTNTAGAQIKQGHKQFHIEVDGEKIPLQNGKDPEIHQYVKTLDEDSSEDPLLDLQRCGKYELDNHIENVR
jgi:hypothetical protein